MLLSELAKIGHRDSETEGMTILMCLASKGRYKALCTLLDGDEKPKDIDSQDKNGYTALCWALSSNHIPIVELLIVKGADTTQALKNFPDPEKRALLQQLTGKNMPSMKIGKK